MACQRDTQTTLCQQTISKLEMRCQKAASVSLQTKDAIQLTESVAELWLQDQPQQNPSVAQHNHFFSEILIFYTQRDKVVITYGPQRTVISMKQRERDIRVWKYKHVPYSSFSNTLSIFLEQTRGFIQTLWDLAVRSGLKVFRITKC